MKFAVTISIVFVIFIVFFISNLVSKSKVDKLIYHIIKDESELPNSKLGVHYVRRTERLIYAAIMIGILLFTVYHAYRYQYESWVWYYPFIVMSFIWSTFQLYSSITYKAYELTNTKEFYHLNELHSVVVMPVYNEDKETFAQTLESISNQSVRPSVVYIVEDGSKPENMVEDIVKDWAKTVAIEVKYKYVENGGKRRAQSFAFDEYDLKTDVFLTIDSDTILDKEAIKNMLIPFLDLETMSVAGLLMGANSPNLLSKIVSLGFASSFTNGRAYASKFGSVVVSCGGLAAYRAVVIHRFRHEYLNQIVFKQKAMFGDDRMLTQYASMLGRTVYQETAIGYTLMPVNFSHLTRQRIRWWKSYWWGGFYVIKHHSPRYMIWWIVAGQFVTQFVYMLLFPLIMIMDPIKGAYFPLYIIIYMILLGYIRSFRLLMLKDSEGEWLFPLHKFLVLSPLSTLFHVYLGVCLSYVGFFRMNKVAVWGTRQDVEVSIESTKDSSGLQAAGEGLEQE